MITQGFGQANTLAARMDNPAAATCPLDGQIFTDIRTAVPDLYQWCAGRLGSGVWGLLIGKAEGRFGQYRRS